MAAREIVKYPDPVLKKQAKAVSKTDPNLKRLIKDMADTLREVNGLGLAANQIGVLQRVFVYDDGTGLGVLVNPKIIRAEGEQIGLEGCLSVPGLQGDVKRAEKIIIQGMDDKGKKVKIEAEGLLARIFQHELDHLNGTLFVERADPDSLQYLTEEESPEEE